MFSANTVCLVDHECSGGKKLPKVAGLGVSFEAEGRIGLDENKALKEGGKALRVSSTAVSFKSGTSSPFSCFGIDRRGLPLQISYNSMSWNLQESWTRGGVFTCFQMADERKKSDSDMKII